MTQSSDELYTPKAMSLDELLAAIRPPRLLPLGYGTSDNSAPPASFASGTSTPQPVQPDRLWAGEGAGPPDSRGLPLAQDHAIPQPGTPASRPRTFDELYTPKAMSLDELFAAIRPPPLLPVRYAPSDNNQSAPTFSSLASPIANRAKISYPSVDSLAAQVYNESSSLYQLPNGPAVDPMRNAIANALLNRIDKNVSGTIPQSALSPKEAQAIFRDHVPAAVAAYNSSLAAATKALSRTTAPTVDADSAFFYNNRPTSSNMPNSNYTPQAPFIATFGPYRNVAPTPLAPANNTYFAFFGRPGAAK